MAFVVVLFGASGSGKSTLMSQVVGAGHGFRVHMKETSRPSRAYDGVEITCVSDLAEVPGDYVYQTYGHRYRIERAQIEESIARNEHHFVICNDIEAIERIREDFDPFVRVVFLHFDAPEAELQKIQQLRGISDDEIQVRLGKIETLYRMFVERPNFFDGVVYNRFGSEPADMWRQVRSLIVKFSIDSAKAELEKGVQKAVELVRTQFPESARAANTAAVRDYVFILMAMGHDDPMLTDIHETIKNACGELNIDAERVDDIQFLGAITEKVKGSIQRAEFLIADLTHNRPNVYYEIGYAEALGKPVILTARDDTKPHFDLYGMKILYYSNMTNLRSQLKAAADACRAEVRSSS
jgi:guanylate kinase